MPDAPLLDAISAAALRTLSDPSFMTGQPGEILDDCFTLLAFSWSFSFAAEAWARHRTAGAPATCQAADVTRQLRDALLVAGRRMDAEAVAVGGGIGGGGRRTWASRVAPAARPTSPSAVEAKAATCALSHAEEPKVLDRPRGMIVVLKPVNWEVDGLTSEGGSGAKLLSTFVQAVVPASGFPVVYTSSLDFGFVHRLDVPSSGLVLGGTTLQGLLHLKWQIAVYAIDRHYLTVNHGHAGKRADVLAPIDASTFDTMRSVTRDFGRPAQTHFLPLAHTIFLQGGSISFPFCVIATSIHTGRRHQIRAHARHLGFPTACDGKYTPKDVLILAR